MTIEDMKRLETIVVAVLSILIPVACRAADAPVVSTSTTTSPTHHKRRHHPKKVISDAAIGKSTDTTTAVPATRVGINAGTGNIEIPGISNDSQAGKIGSP